MKSKKSVFNRSPDEMNDQSSTEKQKLKSPVN